MPSERAITQMVDVFTDVIDLGGTEERTAIVPNLSVIDAAPTGLTNFIIVQDDRDGDNILAKTVPGVVYANSDKVNVLFIRGAEPIAFQQGSESANAGLWEIVPATSTDIFYDKGNVGIGETTPASLLDINQGVADDLIQVWASSDVDHGITDDAPTNVYGAVRKSSGAAGGLTFEGLRDANAAADNALTFIGSLGEAATTTKTDQGIISLIAQVKSGTGTASVGADGNMLSISNRADVKVNFDAEGTIHQIPGSDTDLDLLTVQVTGTPSLSWDESEDAFSIDKGLRVTSGDVGIGTTGPDAKLDVLATTTQLRLTHTDGSKFVDFTLDTNHDLTITPSSTGQIILQPTTDSTDFFQVLDADGGTPILNVDSTNERVGIGTATPNTIFEIEQSVSGGQTIFEHENTAAVNVSNNITWRSRALTSTQSRVIASLISNWNDTTDATRTGRFRIAMRVSGASVDVMTIIGRDVGISTATPLARLHVDQQSSSEAIPVLLLDQADVDEPFEKYVGTAAAANLTRSLVAAGDVTTATLIGWRKIEIDDVGNQITDGDYYEPFYSIV